jgi:hypothetical protein
MYINHWYEYFNLSEKTKIQIALRMRHSTKIASKAYRKINVPELKGNFEGYTPKETPTVELSLPRKTIDSFNPSEYAKKYRNDHKDKIQKWRQEFYKANKETILAKKQLALLNKGLVINPTAHSVETYRLRYDDKKKQWVSDVFDKTSVVKIVKQPKDKVVKKPQTTDRVTRSKTKKVFGI